MVKNGGDGWVIVSYLTLRRVIGVLGVLLPIILLLWGLVLADGGRILPSISDYYSLRTRDIFVGVLFTLAFFLYTYRGLERKDNIAGHLACLFALGVALFPNKPAGPRSIVHFASATGLFLTLSYFSLFLFTLTTDPNTMTPEKVKRNRVYRTCGVAMLVCIALIALCNMPFLRGVVAPLNPVFWLEALALWAFGFSWFVKGETLWKDAGT